MYNRGNGLGVGRDSRTRGRGVPAVDDCAIVYLQAEAGLQTWPKKEAVASLFWYNCHSLHRASSLGNTFELKCVRTCEANRKALEAFMTGDNRPLQ